jgi:hypothetical protein
MIGAGVEPLGEIKTNEQVYQKDLIHKVAKIGNINFTSQKIK